MAGEERAPHYRGDLRQTALPEMLAIIDHARVAGVIEAVSGDTAKKVYLEGGYVVHASSSDLADSLGSYLRRSGRLTEEQCSRAMERRAGTSRRLGEVLIDQRMLAPGEVFQAIREHVEAIIWNLFSWEEGTVTFTIGAPDLTGLIRIQIPLRRVILEGVKRAANAKAIVQRMGGRDTLLEPNHSVEALIEVGLDRDEYALLSRVDGKLTLFDLCTDGPLSAADSARILYALSVLGLIRKAGTVSRDRPLSGGIKIKLRPEPET